MIPAASRVLALALAAVVVLAGCGSDSPGPAGGDSLDAVVWHDEDGQPRLEFDAPFTLEDSAARLVADGDGEVIQAGDFISVDYVVISGLDGSELYSTYIFDENETLPVGDGTVDPVFDSLLQGSRVGATIIYGVPDFSEATDSGAFVAMLMAVTIRSVASVLDRAEGTEVEPVDGLPAITLAADGAPSLATPQGDAPGELVAQVLITGEGPVVEQGQSLIVHYSGWLWDGTPFDSSWERSAPLSILLTSGPGGVIQGWVDGLAGQTVGSQVLLIIPPELGYGDAGSGGVIPGGATLIFVVDILAAI